MPDDVKRLDGLRIGEVSGVDHPAHLTEGWVVMKSLTGLSDEDLVEVVAEAQELAKASTQSPSKEIAMSDATSDSTEEMLKSLPEPVRKMVEQANARAAEAEATASAALTEITKAREVAADEQAITKARENYGNIPGLDPSTFGPALRKAAEAAPEVFEEITKALAAANSALGVESALLKEVGSSVTPAAGGGTTLTHLNTLAAAKVAAGEVTSIEEGLTKALTENPGLYTEYLAEKNKEA